MAADFRADVVTLLSQLKEGIAPAKAFLDRVNLEARRKFLDAFAALHAPVAPFTFETRVVLFSAAPEAVAVLQFPRPTEVVGLFATIRALGAPVAAVVPTLDDVDVSLDYDTQTQLTTQRGIGTSTPFVTLSSLTTIVPRLWALNLVSPQPVMNARFRWKRATNSLGVVAPIQQDSIITLAAFTRLIQD